MKIKIFTALSATLLGLIVLCLAGPRVTIDRSVHSSELPENLDQYLAESEVQFSNIRPGAEKTIIWANPSEKGKTSISIIYLHGFSATRQETQPLADIVAQKLGANLYYTRLTGHGQDGQALAEATVNDWLNDTVEALEIGRRLGDKVIVVGTSTGATLATWLAANEDTEGILALVLLSPNFGPKDSMSELILWPWANHFVPLLVGPDRRRTAQNPKNDKFWTSRYPTTALFPMMGTVKLAREADVGNIRQPTLIIFSPDDETINPEKIVEIYSKFGSDVKKMVPIKDTEAQTNHVIVGNMTSPDNNEVVAQTILDFLTPLLK